MADPRSLRNNVDDYLVARDKWEPPSFGRASWFPDRGSQMLTILAGIVPNATPSGYLEPGQRLFLPVHVDGRVGRLEVSVHRFDEQPIRRKSRPVRALGAREFQRVCDAVKTACPEPVRLSAVASLMGLSPWQLSRAFHATAGVTFTAYVLRVRLDAAMRLMVTTQESLCSIAQSSGFSDQTYFSRMFVRMFGITPSKWRATAREGLTK